MLLTLTAVSANALPAKPKPFSYAQPDGTTVTLMLHGDEYFHWITDGNGEKVKIGEDGYVISLSEPSFRSGMKRAASVRKEREEKLAFRRMKAPASGSNHYLVLLVAFKDKAFSVSSPQESFSSMLNDPGYSQSSAVGSARDYFMDNSCGNFTPVFDVYGPVTLPSNIKYYGQNDYYGNDQHATLALLQACELLDSEIDFSQYDHDGDGYVDNVFFYYAGYNEAEGASTNTIWPHAYEVEYAISADNMITNYTFDGVKVNSYACTSELKGTSGKNMCGIGAFCHEFSHVIGLPDLYDTDYEENGTANDMSNFSLMCEGAYNTDGCVPPYMTGIERVLLGWMDFPGTLSQSGQLTIPGIENNVCYALATDQVKEFFMIECRDGSKWDSGIGETGLMICHIDQSSTIIDGCKAYDLWNKWDLFNSINAYESHPCCYVVDASPKKGGSYLFPGSVGATSFTGSTNPSCQSWSGVDAGHHLYDIAFDGTNVTLDYRNEGLGMLHLAQINTISNPKSGIYATGSSFELKMIESSNPPASVAWYFDGNAVNAASVTLTAGEHAVKAVLTYSNGYVETLEQTIIAQ